jgi:hypothetical protein
MLVGNQIDLNEREVPTQVARNWAKENHMLFLETSAVTNINV